MRTIVYGDSAGCIRELRSLLDLIGPAEGDNIWSIGDAVDRGYDNPACLEFVKEHGGVMGNHEYKHVRFKRGILKKLSPSQELTRLQFLMAGKDYDAAVDFMATLPFYIELPEAIIVHAGLEYGIPMEDQDRIVLIGGMSRRRVCGIDKKTGLPLWCARYPKDAKPVIFGHLSLNKGIPCRENLFPIDTGCVAGGYLTAVTLPDFRIYQVPGYKR